MAYELKTRDAYLENARKTTSEIHGPLAVDISSLNRSFSQYSLRIDSNDRSVPPGSTNQFKGAVREFVNVIDAFMGRGASAYLTLNLESELGEFTAFLTNSLDAVETVRKLTISPSFRNFAMTSVYYGRGWRLSLASQAFGTLSSIRLLPGLSVNIWQKL